MPQPRLPEIKLPAPAVGPPMVTPDEPRIQLNSKRGAGWSVGNGGRAAGAGANEVALDLATAGEIDLNAPDAVARNHVPRLGCRPTHGMVPLDEYAHSKAAVVFLTIAQVERARRIGPDIIASDQAAAAEDHNPFPGEAVDDQPPNRAVAGDEVQPRTVAGTGPIQLDQ